MSQTFAAAWLAAREAADHRARAPVTLAALQRWRNGRKAPLRIVDLGCGSGSNMRYLAPRLDGVQSWHLVDYDRRLLAAARRSANAFRAVDDAVITATAQLRDLADLSVALPGYADLITGAALLDLAGARWLRQLAAECARRQAAALFALSYDGHFAFDDIDTEDEPTRAAVNAHQQGDKGLGPALGPNAARYAAGAFAEAGYAVTLAASDWRLGAAEATLRAALVDGWAAAAKEQHATRAGAIEAWRCRRRDTAESATLWVGHLDLFASPVRE